MKHFLLICKCEKDVFFVTLLECMSITDRVGTLPRNLKNVKFNNLEKKNLELENFEKNLGFLTFLLCSASKLRFTTFLKP